MLRQAGRRVIYLGSRVPVSSLKQVVEFSEIENMMFFISQTKQISDAQQYIDELSASFKKIKIYLSGSADFIANLHLPKKMQWLKNSNDLEALISDVVC